jgi:glycosyltransferase involved in cell wall biosynthesis
MLANKSFLKNKVRIIEQVLIKELSIIYQSAISLVFPSFYEGFGYPPLEAMSLGCPVIVSNAASLPEICLDAAYYINPYDYRAISEAMRKMIEDKEIKNRLIEKGKIRVKSFTIEKFIQKHIDQIEALL